MAEHESAAEAALLHEFESHGGGEAGVADDAGRRSHFQSYLSFYISAISLVVAVAALLTALSADQAMKNTLTGLTDLVENNGLRIELRCHEIERNLAEMRGVPSAPTPALTPVSLETGESQLTRRERESLSLRREAGRDLHAHHVLAVGITFLQIATALAATVGITKKRGLLAPSALFAVGGVGLTLAGAVDFLA